MITTMIVMVVAKQHWDRSQLEARMKTSSMEHVIITTHGDTSHLIVQKDMHVTTVTSTAIVQK